ncbi:hypothetical protein [Luteimonas sp. A482]
MENAGPGDRTQMRGVAMPSFPSLHDALFSLLPGARAGLDRAPWPGAPGFAEGPDADDVDVPKPRGQLAPDVDLPSHLHRLTPGGEGPGRHAPSDAGSSHHSRTGMPDADPSPHVPAGVPDGMRGQGAHSLTPASGQIEPSLQALARELQQLPPSVIRQLSHALSADPAVLRDLPARPEALAIALSRTAGETRPLHPAAGEARLAGHGPDAARGQDADAVRDARLPGAPGDARAAADARGAAALEARQAMAATQALPGQAAEPRPAWAMGLDPELAGHVLARSAPALEAQTLRALAPRMDPAAVAMPGHPSATTPAVGNSQAQPGALPLSQGESPVPGARGEPGTPVAAERGAQAPGLGGLGGAAAGVTLAAVANPAGTTHAYAPDSAVRARRPQQSRDQRQGGANGGTGQEEAPDGQPGDVKQQQHPRAGAAATGAGAAGGTGEAARAQSAAAVAGHVASASVAHVHHEDDQAAPAGHVADDEARHSRAHLQWLYWSLIAVTYCCLGLALATVAPDLFGLPMPPESLDIWRNALTGTGLLTGLWAWLLARRLR